MDFLKRNPLIMPLYLPSVMYATCIGMLIPVLPVYAGEFEVGYTLIGVVLAGREIGTILGDIPAGVLCMRLGTKRVMVLGLLITTVATAALFGAGSIAAVLILRIVAGVGRAFYNLGRHNYVAAGIGRGNRGKALSGLGGTFRVGSFLGPLIGGVVAGQFGLDATFLAYGALGAAALGVVAAFAPADVPTSAPVHPVGGLWGVVRGNARILTITGIGQIFGFIVRMGRAAIIPLYADDVLGLSVGRIGVVTSASFGADALLFPLAGVIMDRFGRKWAIVPSFAIQAVGMALIPLAGGFWGLLVPGVIMGLGNGISAGAMMTLGADLAPPGARGEFLGVWRLIGDVGIMGGPLVVGIVADALLLSSAALVLGASGGLAALVFGLFVPETLRRLDDGSP